MEKNLGVYNTVSCGVEAPKSKNSDWKCFTHWVSALEIRSLLRSII